MYLGLAFVLVLMVDTYSCSEAGRDQAEDDARPDQVFDAAGSDDNAGEKDDGSDVINRFNHRMILLSYTLHSGDNTAGKIHVQALRI